MASWQMDARCRFRDTKKQVEVMAIIGLFTADRRDSGNE